MWTFLSGLVGPSSANNSDWEQLATSPSSRDGRLDSFRGLALVIMMVDHLQGELKNYTYHVFGYVTAAEMFIFLSGLVAGMVYTKRFAEESYPTLRTKCQRRAATLYLYHVISFAALIGLAQLSQTMFKAWEAWIPNLRGSLLLEDPLAAMGLASVLLYQPTHLDILPMYALLLLMIPWALRITKRWGPAPLLVIGIAGWLLAQGGRTHQWMGERLAPLELEPPYFDIIAWQFLFWMGLTLGAGRVLSRPWLSKLIRWGWIPGLLVAVFCLVMRYNQDLTNWALSVFDLRSATKIPWLAWFRLTNFLCLALGVAGLAMRWPKVFTWPWFSLLGRHSLQVYTAHIAIIFLAAPLSGWIAGTGSKGWDYALTALALALLTLSAFLHQVWINARKSAKSEPCP